MKSKHYRWIGVVGAAALVAGLAVVMIAQARGNDGNQDDIAKIRAATAKFHDTAVAQSEGWDLRAGLDACFDNPGVGAMGYHYINTDSLMNLWEDVLRPEAFVYAPGPNGQRQLGAVEWIVPQGPWDAAGNTMPPMLLGHHFHLDPALGVYILHAWIFKENPAGMFEDWNPKVSCQS